MSKKKNFCQELTVVDVFITQVYTIVFAGFVYEITIKKLFLKTIVIFFCKIHSQFEKIDKFQGFVNNRIKLFFFAKNSV